MALVERWDEFEERTYTPTPLRGPSATKLPLARIFPPWTSLGYGRGEYDGVVRSPRIHHIQSRWISDDNPVLTG